MNMTSLRTAPIRLQVTSSWCFTLLSTSNSSQLLQCPLEQLPTPLPLHTRWWPAPPASVVAHTTRPPPHDYPPFHYLQFPRRTMGLGSLVSLPLVPSSTEGWKLTTKQA
ncbi:hypothetical protein SISNIDRAFT_316292 [Sistotremastrum niveocremeum HHB9708]|uniref:Uncharacterized protein n=1 Tax=Sistotremastrum niveocremeum HHB9708 TaxID=1314777 RepID=A0A164Y0M5_9AGAM|nr:hypothetical protein SISNIDRAFT_316292 [Sistotremastrum niveocremeum HHB9708]